MALDLTKKYEKFNDIKRNIFYKKDLSIKFYSVNKLLLELHSGFYISKYPKSNLSIGAEYFEASVISTNPDINLENIIPLTDNILVGLDKYILAQYFRPRAETKKWELRLESAGKYKHSDGR